MLCGKRIPTSFLERQAKRLLLQDGLRVSMLCVYVYRTQRHGASFGIK